MMKKLLSMLLLVLLNALGYTQEIELGFIISPSSPEEIW